jgi:hypothetical protein
LQALSHQSALQFEAAHTVAGALVPHSRQEPAPRDGRAVYAPSRQGLYLARQLAPALQNGRYPNGAICAEPPTPMVQESGVPIRRSVSTPADSEDPSDSPKRSEAPLCRRDGYHSDRTRSDHRVAVSLALQERRRSDSTFLTVQHHADLRWLQARKELKLLMNCKAASAQRSLTKIAICL